MNNEQGFKATRSFTVLLSTLLAGVMAFVFLPYFALVKNNVFMLVLGPVILATIAMFAPLRYVVSDSGIIVKRLGADIEISFETVKHVERIDRNYLKCLLRVFGVGGFLGMYGSFYSSEIGMFRMAATNYSSLVLIVYGEGKKLVVTPDRAEEFVAVVDSKKLKPFM